MNCTLTSQSSPSSGTSRSGGVDELRAVARLEPHREPGPHRFARLHVAEHQLGRRGRCRRPCAPAPSTSSITSSGGKSSVADRLERLVDRQRQRTRARLEQRAAAVDGGREDAEAARALGGRAASCRRRRRGSRATRRPRGTPRASGDRWVSGSARRRSWRRSSSPACPGSARSPRGIGDEQRHREVLPALRPARAPRTSSSADAVDARAAGELRERLREGPGRRHAARRGTRRTGSDRRSRSLMSVPITSSVRSPFSRSARTRRGPPGEPVAVTSTRSGLIRPSGRPRSTRRALCRSRCRACARGCG